MSKKNVINTFQPPNTHNPPELGTCPTIDTYRLGAQICKRLTTSTKIHINRWRHWCNVQYILCQCSWTRNYTAQSKPGLRKMMSKLQKWTYILLVLRSRLLTRFFAAGNRYKDLNVRCVVLHIQEECTMPIPGTVWKCTEQLTRTTRGGMIVLLDNAIQRILPRTSDYHQITFLTHPRSVVTIRVTKFNVQKLCIFLHKFSVFSVVLTANIIPLRLCLLWCTK
jgi:hypothetical protein